MKRKIITMIVPIVTIIIFVVCIINYDNYFSLKGYSNTNLMITHNGDRIDSFPIKDSSLYYNVEVNCGNNDASWDYTNWGLKIEDINLDLVKCNIDFTSSEKITLYNKIIADWNNLDGTNNIYKENHSYYGDGIPDYFEYRYEGPDTEVENYVWFNNELWRIIGAFPGAAVGTVSVTSGVGAPSTNNTVKIIRYEDIGVHSWDKNNVGNWTTASLNVDVLNNLYLNSLSGNCYHHSSTIVKSCDFTNIGLNNVKNYLEDVTWYLGSTRYDVTPNTMYIYERYNNVPTNNPLTTSNKVGIMYPTDYGYSSSSDDCQNNTYFGNYGSCGVNGWILKYPWEMFMTVFINSSGSYPPYYAFRIHTSGNLSTKLVYYSTEVRPVVHLNNSVYVTGGDGSITNPFQIELKS